MKLFKPKFNKLSVNSRINIVLRVCGSVIKKKKIKKSIFSKLSKSGKIKLVLDKIKKNYPSLLKKISLRLLYRRLRNKNKKLNRKYEQKYKKNAKFLSKSLRNVITKFPRADVFGKKKRVIKKKLRRMNRVSVRKRMRTNYKKKSFFFRINRKNILRRKKIRLFRSRHNKPIFTKKSKQEKKFLIRARDSLIKTKKFLYRKKFPKIKGKKNKNFNFFYYNNIDRIPLKFFIGRVVITYLINNTFINIHSSKKMLKVISAGGIGFKGPKRATPYSRQIVARKAVTFLLKTKLNVLDIFLNSNYNRWYYFLFKEISKPKVKPYIIRYLIINNTRPHGFIRDKKHRRK